MSEHQQDASERPSPELPLVVRLARASEHRGIKVAAVVVAAASMALVWHAVGSSGSAQQQGRVIASERQSIHLGLRGVAVAESGTALHWRVQRSGAAVVSQERGNVFYRVEPGGSFEVRTARGTVSVTDTCFRVEIYETTPSTDAMRGDVVGAELATTVTVTVYEGSVVISDAGGADSVVEAGGRVTLGQPAPVADEPVGALP